MRTERVRRAHAARSALSLRDAVLRYLGASGLGSAREPLLAAAPASWSFLLRVECCALPLLAHLRRDALLDRFDDVARAQLLAAEARELQRVLAARLIVRELDAIGQRAGLRFIALKGGAVAADATRQPLDLGDVDVLVTGAPPEHAWHALLSHGWSPVLPGFSPTDDIGTRAHYSPLRSDRHQLALELHPRYDYQGAGGAEQAPTVAPIPGHRAIDRLTGAGAVAATLRHSVVVHPHRRGHLRDLFLLADLLKELDDSESSRLERDLSGAEERIELLAMLAQARALSRGEPLADAEALRPFVCFKYAAAAGTSALLGTGSAGWDAVSHLPLERRPIRRAAYRRLLRAASEPVPADAELERVPLIGSRLSRAGGLSRLARYVYRTALTLGLIAVGGLIRRRVAALNFVPKGVD
ncbi:MAG TPA: hypothetical protein VF461_07625 [Gemmatimonadaceae bacterium]